MGWWFATSFWAKEKQETVSDFLLGGAAGGRLVFSFESSGQGGPMMKYNICMKIIQLLLVILQQKYRKVLQVQKDLMWKGRMFHFPILKQPAC